MSWFPQFLFGLSVFALAILGALWLVALAARQVWRCGAASWRWFRSHDVELVVSRSLAYALVAGLLALLYVGGVALLQALLSPVTQGSQLSVAGSTLVVAGVFQPARQWIQAQVDRRFYRRRYDAQRTLDAFGARLRDQLDADTLRRELVWMVRQTVQPASVWLWLRPQQSGAPK